MGGRYRGALVLLAGVLCALGLTEAGLAYDGFLAPVAEIPLTSPSTSGARAAGMGGAYLAVGDDAAALAWNPAALARLRRIEASIGLSREAHDRDGTAFGEEFGTSASKTTFSSFRLAYPFPTFRGSLVLALSGDRTLNFYDDFLSAYDDTITWEEDPGQYLTDVWHQTEDYLTEGGVYAWTFGAAFDASPNVSLGAAVSYWAGEYGRHFSWEATDQYDKSDNLDAYEFRVDEDADISGVRAKLGGLFYVSGSLALGLVVDSPITLSFDTISHTSETWTESSGATVRVDTSEYFVDEITLPFSFAAGAAYTPLDALMLAADVRYTDWSELNYEGPVYLGNPADRARAFEATTDFHLGVEVSVPEWPLRLRGGYMSRPIAYQGLNIDKDRSYFTLGAGVLIDTIFAIDIAWMTATHERSGDGYDYDETLAETAILMEAAYRF
jgi:hypothetical protein